jgi:hypothetical protein
MHHYGLDMVDWVAMKDGCHEKPSALDQTMMPISKSGRNAR